MHAYNRLVKINGPQPNIVDLDSQGCWIDTLNNKNHMSRQRSVLILNTAIEKANELWIGVEEKMNLRTIFKIILYWEK